MTTGKRPDGTVFASGAAEGEVQDFPSTARGWGVTIDGKDESGTAVTDATNGIPPMEWFNGLLKRIDENVWWLLQNALPDWLAGTWPKGAVVVNGDIVWRAQKETATEPTSSNGDWLELFPLKNLDGRYLSLSGGTLTNDGAVITLKAKTAGSGVYLIMDDSDGSNLCYVGKGSKDNNDAVFNNYKGSNNSIILRANGSVDLTAQQSQPINLNSEPRTTSPNAWRIVYGDYGAFWRQDGGSLYLMLTNKGDPRGSYNALRPFRVDMSTGAVTIGTPLGAGDTLSASKEITAGYSGTFAWADQYKTKAPFFNSYATTGASEYHPAIKQLATVTDKNSWAFSMGSLVAGTVLSWHLHMKGSGGSEINYTWDTSGNFTAPGELVPGKWDNFDARYYTQAAANGKFQPKGNYTPEGEAYTRAESDARFGLGKTTTGSNNAYYTHGNGIVFMQAIRSIAVGNNATVTVTLPTSFPNGILGIGSSYYGTGGNNQASFYLCTPVGKNQVRIQTHNCNGTFSLNVTGY